MTPWILSFHLIFMVAWFAGLFYLPRLFMYHTLSTDQISQARFKTMEHKLFWIIMTPAGILTSVFGVWLLLLNPQYLHQNWMLVKLFLVMLLWLYHLLCGYLLQQFKCDHKYFSSTFYRFFNEVPTLFLLIIIILAIVHP